MQNNKLDLKRIIILAGSFISFAIGSGFATGQESMQFFGAYGLKAIYCLIFFIVINLYIDMNYLDAGYKGQFEKGTQVYQYFAGKYIGTLFDWFAAFFCYVLFIIMIAGAGATINQQYGLSNSIGGIILAVVACATVLLGLNKMVNILGVAGPAIVVMAIMTSIIGIINGQMGVLEGAQRVLEMDILSAGDSWVNAAITYNGFGMLMFGGFISTMGKIEENINNARIGISLGIVAVAVAMGFMVAALLANIELVAGSQIPTLAMVNSFSPTFATIYSIVIVLAIFSTATPCLWTMCDRLAKPNTKQYTVVGIVLTVIATIVALSMPFDQLVNIMFTVNGYAGFVLIVFLIGRSIKDFVIKKNNNNVNNVENKQ